MEQRKPYAAPAVELAGAFSELTEGAGELEFDLLGFTNIPVTVVIV